MNTIDRMNARFDAAIEGWETEYHTKSAQKDALAKMNRAYDAAREVVREAVRVAADERFDGNCPERFEFLDQWDMPFDLHHVRDRHVAVAAHWNLRAEAIIKALVDMRAVAKAAPIVAVERNTEVADKIEIVQSSIRAEMERMGKMYAEALEVGRLFNGLPVTANIHMVTNQYGTTFLRAFYYLNGKRMPVNLIIAAAQALADEKRASA